MMQELSGIDELLSKSPILKKAVKVSQKNAIRPRELMRKLGILLLILIVGVVGLILTIVSIRWGAFHGSEQQALAGMLVLLSGTVILVSVMGGLVSLWNAFLSTYMESQGSRVETAEVSDQYTMLVESLAAPVEQGEAAVVAGAYPLNEPVAEAVSAVARAAPAETARMVTVVRQMAETSAAALIKQRD
jgi:hypothetical protein